MTLVLTTIRLAARSGAAGGAAAAAPATCVPVRPPRRATKESGTVPVGLDSRCG